MFSVLAACNQILSSKRCVYATQVTVTGADDEAAAATVARSVAASSLVKVLQKKFTIKPFFHLQCQQKLMLPFLWNVWRNEPHR